VNHDRLHNLLWVWEAAPSDFRSGGAGTLSDFFPGLLYTDALELRLNELDSRSYPGRMLAQIAVGKPIGVEVTGNLPLPEAFTNSTGWAWVATARPN
jgi:hypothetical protein